MKGPAIKSLSENWKIQSSKEVKYEGSKLSTDIALSHDWYPARVPSTVLGTLVENGVYDDPYFGDNLKAIPKEEFKTSWWYMNTFCIDDVQEEQFANLGFHGINYKANVWLNGKQIANSKDIDGAYRRTSFDVSTEVVSGWNILAIEVIPPRPGDFSTGFVDWNPAPPDGNMGIFRPVTLTIHRGVRVENPLVRTPLEFDGQTPLTRLKISAELHNDCDYEIEGILKGVIGEVSFEQPVSISAGAKKLITFNPEEFSELIIYDPKLWWPWHLGKQYLHDLDLEFVVHDRISDTAHTRFGIREISDFWLEDIHRGYRVNGKKVLIKGAGWTDDLLLMDDHKSIEAQVKYVRHMNLNCIRLEGIWGKDQYLFDLCDEYGILLMVGWSCHWEHEIHMGIPVSERYGAVYKEEDINHVAQAWEDQVLWLRNHPSIFVWTVASDKVPITTLEKKYIETFAQYDPDRPYLNSTGGVGSDQHVIGSEDVISEISGSSGVKMLGPYAYTAPVYWFTDTRFGGAYGFNTETGPGAQPPRLSSIKKFIPADKLWPINEMWEYHCALYEFSGLDRFTTALKERYGRPDSIEEFDKKAQAMNYELMRPMFEAFQVNKEKSTGVIQWMLNAAWPKMYWQLYDYFLNPNAAFYATKKALAPLQLMYNYGDKNIYAINDHTYRVENLYGEIHVLDIDSNVVMQRTVTFDMAPDSTSHLCELEIPKDISTTWFLDLRLKDNKQNDINTNFYWLSTQDEILDYEADVGEFAFHTPSSQYADLSLLNQLPKVEVRGSYSIKEGETMNEISVTLQNMTETLAFLINLNLVDRETGEDVLPVFWEDNFISLLPHEKRIIRVTYDKHIDATPKVEGWNIDYTQNA